LKKLLMPSQLDREVAARIQELRAFRDCISDAVSKAPPGKIRIAKDERRIQYYLRKSPQDVAGTYVSLQDVQKLTTYLQKSYNEKILKEIDAELAVLEPFRISLSKHQNSFQEVFDSFPDKSKTFLKPIDLSDAEYASAWAEIPYVRKPIPDEYAGFITDRGERVRSKSEINIANALNKYGILYKYECPLALRKGMTIHPDFTVLDVKRRKVVYWEHRGIMDDREYARQAVKRIKDYQTAGIFLGDRLIITEETSVNPLGTQEIRKVIEKYFG